MTFWHSPSEHQKGLIYALSCYLLWGLFPIFWSPLYQVLQPEIILAHRIVWSAVFAGILLMVFQQFSAVQNIFRQPKLFILFVFSSVLIGINWLIYLWALSRHHILEASLGYFMNPLFNVLLGRLIFKEKMGKPQKIALILACVGVLWLAILGGQFPFVAIGLASSFSLYAVCRKLAPTDALSGLVVETLLLLPFALIYLVFYAGQSFGETFGQLNHLQFSILLASGAATTLPLLGFAAAARRIPLTHLGILQYCSPTLQLLCGWLIFGEQLDSLRLWGYVWVWLGVLVFLWGMVRTNRP